MMSKKRRKRERKKERKKERKNSTRGSQDNILLSGEDKDELKSGPKPVVPGPENDSKDKTLADKEHSDILPKAEQGESTTKKIRVLVSETYPDKELDDNDLSMSEKFELCEAVLDLAVFDKGEESEVTLPYIVIKKGEIVKKIIDILGIDILGKENFEILPDMDPLERKKMFPEIERESISVKDRRKVTILRAKDNANELISKLEKAGMEVIYNEELSLAQAI